MIVHSNEVGYFSDMKFSLMNRTGVESNGSKEIYSNIEEHRTLKRNKRLSMDFEFHTVQKVGPPLLEAVK